MLSTVLFLVFFSLYMWLYYKPNHTSSQHHRYASAAKATATPFQAGKPSSGSRRAGLCCRVRAST